MPDHLETISIKKIDNYFKNPGTSNPSESWVQKVLKHKIELRDEKEIDYEYNRALILYQRCIIGSYIREGAMEVPSESYDELFKLEENGFPVGPGGDIRLISDKYVREFCDITKDEESVMAPMALVRVQSLRWLRDPYQDWDEMPLDDLEELPI